MNNHAEGRRIIRNTFGIIGWFNLVGLSLMIASSSIGRTDLTAPSAHWAAVAAGSFVGALFLWAAGWYIRQRTGHNTDWIAAGLPLLFHADGWLLLGFQYFHDPTNHLLTTGLVTTNLFARPSIIEWLVVKYIVVGFIWTVWPWISAQENSSSDAEPSHSMQVGLIVAAVVGSLAYIRINLLDVLLVEIPSDLRVNYIGALAMREGLNPYDNAVALQLAGRERIPYVGTQLWTLVTNPPTAMLYFAPFSAISITAARLAFLAINQLAFLTTLILTWRLTGPRIHPAIWTGLVLGLVSLLDPFALALRLGQIDLVLGLALAFAAYRLRNGDSIWAGLAIGIATSFKISPGLLIFYLLWRGHWRAIFSTLATALALGAFSLSLSGLETWQYYLTIRLPDLLAGSALYNNLSLPGLFLRVFMGPELAQKFLALQPEIVAAKVLTVAGIITTVGTTAFALGRSRLRGHSYILEFSLVLVAILLIGGITWPHYVGWLLPLIGLFAGFHWPSRANRWVALLAGLGIAIAAVPIDTYSDLFISLFDRSMMALSIRTGGLLLLFLALTIAVRAAPRNADQNAGSLPRESNL